MEQQYHASYVKVQEFLRAYNRWMDFS